MLSIKDFAKPRKQENLSIRIEPISDYPPHQVDCACRMCVEYPQNMYLCMYSRINKMMESKYSYYKRKIQKRAEGSKLTSQHLQYFLSKLILPHNKIVTKGVGMLIPQICFYRQGQADSLFMNVENEHQQRGRETYIMRIRKQKLTNTQIQKIINEKRRKYRDRIKNPNKKKIIKVKPLFGKKQIIPEAKDAVIVKYLDGYEQLMTQNQFINLMLKRKQDPIFKKIDFIKNFIGVSDELSSLLFLYHNLEECKYVHLMSRAYNLMKVYAENIIKGDKDYISNEDESAFCSNLKQQSIDSFAHYTLYKAIAFIETFYDQKITSISVKFLINELGQIYLLHVYKLKKTDLIKYTWTNEVYSKRVLKEEAQLLQKESAVQEHDDKMAARSRKISEQMEFQYQSMKKLFGLSHVEQDDQEQIKNNQFFAYIHPELTMPLSQYLKDHSMTADLFQTKYLGYRKTKKPVARQFNSNLVKTLHRVAPQLRRAQPHQIEDSNFPKTPRKFNSRTRCASMGNTISTLNKSVTPFA